MTSGDVESGFAAFTMVLMCCGERYLMLKRASEKTFAPDRWTGIGGRVEASEFEDIVSSALREITEETGYQVHEIQKLVLRRTLLQQRPQHPTTVLFYLTADVQDMRTTETREGTLHWLTQAQMDEIDIIENTRIVIPQLIADRIGDPPGTRQQITGACSFDPAGDLVSIIWAD